MKYLKKFLTHSAYNTYINGNPIFPNVSFCEDLNEVHYNKDPYNGHNYVEIAGIKWATMNIGALNITDTGFYFLWGDTQGYTASQVGSGSGLKYFGWADYKYGNGTSSPGAAGMTKYNGSDGLTTLQPSDDVVTAAWGSGWRMPTTAEFQALGAAVNTAWTDDYQGSGVSGLVLTDKTDESKTLFFPACGYCSNGSMGNVGSNGLYWSSSLGGPNNVMGAYILSFFNDAAYWDFGNSRFYGYSVRGVADPYNTNGHTFVDLGLPSGTKWATMNVGAESETDYGNYYMYGKGATQYNSSDTAYAGIEDPLDLSVDTARLVWGGAWHMPTQEQCEELVDNTSYEFVTDYQGSGINGGLFTAENGNELFIPAADSYYEEMGGGSHTPDGSCGIIWSSTPKDNNDAFTLYFSENNLNVDFSSHIVGNGRDSGFSIRPVIG